MCISSLPLSLLLVLPLSPSSRPAEADRVWAGSSQLNHFSSRLARRRTTGEPFVGGVMMAPTYQSHDLPHEAGGFARGQKSPAVAAPSRSGAWMGGSAADCTILFEPSWARVRALAERRPLRCAGPALRQAGPNKNSFSVGWRPGPKPGAL